ncbi:RelA/SpoT domain-containing protein [bacterium]|nr:RelA/SpoT domain-containing protein [bacterium]MBU1884880.1 RelA/SpoT domain-containing protein [bacterium]
MPHIESIETLLNIYDDKLDEIKMLKNQVFDFFQLNKELNSGNPSIVHSLKARIKDREHLREKLKRKFTKGEEINDTNFFEQITDFAGVRVIHLYQDQFPVIHNAIMKQIDKKNWVLGEQPKAYTWDPESKVFFEELGLEVEQKESFYTSIHYLVKPHNEFPFYCEIQVRTLFEEIWGEIDHSVNYPLQTKNIATREQLRVLSKLVGAGSRLADSIFRTLPN